MMGTVGGGIMPFQPQNQPTFSQQAASQYNQALIQQMWNQHGNQLLFANHQKSKDPDMIHRKPKLRLDHEDGDIYLNLGHLNDPLVAFIFEDGGIDYSLLEGSFYFGSFHMIVPNTQSLAMTNTKVRCFRLRDDAQLSFLILSNKVVDKSEIIKELKGTL
jgi:hypothetical protein